MAVLENEDPGEYPLHTEFRANILQRLNRHAPGLIAHAERFVGGYRSILESAKYRASQAKQNLGTRLRIVNKPDKPHQTATSLQRTRLNAIAEYRRLKVFLSAGDQACQLGFQLLAGL